MAAANDDFETEAQWYDEIASLLSSAAARYSRFAGLLRVAGGALSASELEGERLEIRRVTYRLGQVLQADDRRTESSVDNGGTAK